MSIARSNPFPLERQFAVSFIESSSFIDTDIFHDISTSKPPFKLPDPERILKAKTLHPDDHELHGYLEDSLADDEIYLGQFKWWQRAVSIIALYHTLEIQRTKMLSLVPEKPKGSWNFHKIDEVIKFLGKLQIKHNLLAREGDVETLRLITNNIKHSGEHVGSYLAKGTTLVKGDPLELEALDVARYSQAAKEYLSDLSNKLSAFILA